MLECGLASTSKRLLFPPSTCVHRVRRVLLLTCFYIFFSFHPPPNSIVSGFSFTCLPLYCVVRCTCPMHKDLGNCHSTCIGTREAHYNLAYNYYYDGETREVKRVEETFSILPLVGAGLFHFFFNVSFY